ncbi:MAG: gluconate 2-dehydrogenase subunit 3 family protein, partial [Caulobacteraceae bacterium]
ASVAVPAQAQPVPGRREALETLSATEADVLEAVCARLIPSDETGPGAREARAAHYIDRSLAGALASSREAYRAGLTGLDERAKRMKGQAFARLPDADQDAVLIALEKDDAGFFGLVRGHTLQGTFGDPYYGGNAGFVGWDMIGYPGVRLAVTQPQQAMDPHLQKVRMSAYDFSMFDRSGARVAMANPAPVDHEHMASGMGDPQHDR